jgi:hypothetical protein
MRIRTPRQKAFAKPLENWVPDVGETVYVRRVAGSARSKPLSLLGCMMLSMMAELGGFVGLRKCLHASSAAG